MPSLKPYSSLKGCGTVEPYVYCAADTQADLRALQQTQNSLLAFLRDISTHTDITSATPAFTAWINGALAQLTECDTAGVLWVDAARSTLVYWSAEQVCVCVCVFMCVCLCVCVGLALAIIEKAGMIHAWTAELCNLPGRLCVCVGGGGGLTASLSRPRRGQLS